MFVSDPAQIAFRAGVQDLPFNDRQGPQPDRPVSVTVHGTIESKYETLEGIPGLTDSKKGYETGRALRYIAYYLDKNGFDIKYGEYFLGQVVHAVWKRGPDWESQLTAFLLAYNLFPQRHREQQELLKMIQEYVFRKPSAYI